MASRETVYHIMEVGTRRFTSQWWQERKRVPWWPKLDVVPSCFLHFTAGLTPPISRFKITAILLFMRGGAILTERCTITSYPWVRSTTLLREPASINHIITLKTRILELIIYHSLPILFEEKHTRAYSTTRLVTLLLSLKKEYTRIHTTIRCFFALLVFEEKYLGVYTTFWWSGATINSLPSPYSWWLE